MSVKKEPQEKAPGAMTMQVSNNLKVQIIPNQDHEFLMTTEEVASGYGVSSGTLYMTRSRHLEEIIEGKHFISIKTPTLTKREVRSDQQVVNPDSNLQTAEYLWTKRGIVRLGFFIKRSMQAKMFRDWAEDLVINALEGPKHQALKILIEQAAKVTGNQKSLAGACNVSEGVLSDLKSDRITNISDRLKIHIAETCNKILKDGFATPSHLGLNVKKQNKLSRRIFGMIVEDDSREHRETLMEVFHLISGREL